MMRRQLVWLVGVGATLAVAGRVGAAPPGDATLHHDVKKSIPSEYGSDEEVRQLLDLKGLAAQRDLGNLKRNVQLTLTPAPDSSSAAASSSSSSSSAEGNKGMTEHQPKPADETAKAGNVDKKSESEKNVPSGVEGDHGTPEADHQVEDDHMQLQRQQLTRPHVRYTPLDLALYVYKTGDEEGVTLAIQELIAEGLMSAEEALNYLREIRENLHYLNQQDEQEQMQGVEEEMSGNGLKAIMKKNSLPLPLTEMTLADPETMLAPEVDYDSLIERLRGQDYVSTEYSLEEVIYQLAKILFKQAMHREGDIGSEKALQEVAALLEKEAARGAITPEVEKKVLDVMVNSLVDSISENEFPSGPGPMTGGPMTGGPMSGGPSLKLPNQSPFPMGNSALMRSPGFKPTTDLFQLTKSTTKREAPEDTKKVTEGKN